MVAADDIFLSSLSVVSFFPPSPPSPLLHKTQHTHTPTQTKGRVERLLALLGAQANLISADSNGASPLHLAVLNGHRECAALLIEKGSLANAQDDRCALSPPTRPFPSRRTPTRPIPTLCACVVCVCDQKGG